MTTTHTPGPWTIEADPDKAGRHPLHDNRHVVAHSGTVCDLRDQPAQAADARLIAAAPDLLHALKWAAEYVSLYTGDGGGWTGLTAADDRSGHRFVNQLPWGLELDPESLRAYLALTIAKAEEA